MKRAGLLPLLLAMLLGAPCAAFAQDICDFISCAEGYHCELVVGCVRNACPGPMPTAQEAFDAADGVVSGRVLAITPVDFSFDYHGFDVALEPIQRWKGPLGATLHVYMGLPYPGDVPFVVGEDYLVFWILAPGVPTGLRTSTCMGTAGLVDNPFVAALPPPLLPTPARGTSWGSLKGIYR